MGLVHQRLCREVLNRRNTLRTVRQRTADGPPEAVQNSTEAVSVGLQCQSGYSVKIQRRTVREWTERWGRPDLIYKRCPSHSPPPNHTYPPKSSLSFSLKHVGETTRSR